jgi:hypothetical protein
MYMPFDVICLLLKVMVIPYTGTQIRIYIVFDSCSTYYFPEVVMVESHVATDAAT